MANIIKQDFRVQGIEIFGGYIGQVEFADLKLDDDNYNVIKYLIEIYNKGKYEMEDLFDINKFNIIKDEENYDFFRVLNMADNYDLETGTTLGEDGNIERIRT